MTSDDAATLTAHIMGVDHVARTMEAKWGIERLPLLVDAELRARFMRQAAKWRDALEEAWAAAMLTRDMLAAVASRSAAMERAWAALDAAAEEAGHRPCAPWVWEVVLKDGTIAAFVQTTYEASKVIADGRYLVVYTAEEVGHVIDALPASLAQAKAVFPGVKVLPPRMRANRPHQPGVPFDDPIPFGDEDRAA